MLFFVFLNKEYVFHVFVQKKQVSSLCFHGLMVNSFFIFSVLKPEDPRKELSARLVGREMEILALENAMEAETWFLLMLLDACFGFYDVFSWNRSSFKKGLNHAFLVMLGYELAFVLVFPMVSHVIFIPKCAVKMIGLSSKEAQRRQRSFIQPEELRTRTPFFSDVFGRLVWNSCSFDSGKRRLFYIL